MGRSRIRLGGHEYVPVTAREWPTDAVLSVGSGFGGFQSAMVLARPDRRNA